MRTDATTRTMKAKNEIRGVGIAAIVTVIAYELVSLQGGAHAQDTVKRRRTAFADRHDGDQRSHGQKRHHAGDRRDQCQGRRAGQSKSSRWSRTARRNLGSSPKRRKSLFRTTRSSPCSGDGPRPAARRCCRCSSASTTLLWYPVQFEGNECSPDIMYSGAQPNQQILAGARLGQAERLQELLPARLRLCVSPHRQPDPQEAYHP